MKKKLLFLTQWAFLQCTAIVCSKLTGTFILSIMKMSMPWSEPIPEKLTKFLTYKHRA